MAIPDETICLYHAQITAEDGTYRIEVPDHEVRLAGLAPGQTYRIAILPSAGKQTTPSRPSERAEGDREAPVSEGDQVEVEIEDVGEQGDGVARINEGYIVFVPETEIGDRVTVQIGNVTENFAFGEVVEGPY